MPSFEIYQGSSSIDTKGLYDYGPLGCALQRNVVDLWRAHFILEEDMLEIESPSITPHEVLEASGHVDKFLDWVSRDAHTGQVHRSDHLVKHTLQRRLKADATARRREHGRDSGKEELGNTQPKARKSEEEILSEDTRRVYQETVAKLDSFDGEELGRIIIEHDVRSPVAHNHLESPTPFHLMFPTTIGPAANTSSAAFLRPETAQSQFVNFHKLLEYSQDTLPFASASVGKAYRNEISPRNGLLRVREFTLAEIEHYVDPEAGKRHDRFQEVVEVKLPFLTRQVQLDGRDEIERLRMVDAVGRGLVASEALGYFLARTWLFLLRLGIDPQKVRFRQHLPNEMAHYASDCWDAELLTSYGWIECVGLADRAAYDLTAHSNKTGTPLTASEPLKEPQTIDEWHADFNLNTLGPLFKSASNAIVKHVRNLPKQSLQSLSEELARHGEVAINIPNVETSQPVTLTSGMVSIAKRPITHTHRTFTPHVIEPSFGLTRILYCTLEHVFHTRPAASPSQTAQDSDSPARTLLSLPPQLSPTKVLLAPVVPLPQSDALLSRLRRLLKAQGLAVRLDTSKTSIGKKYARADEVGTAYGVTVDAQSLEDGTVTLRERDSMEQVRGGAEDMVGVVRSLCEGGVSWADVRGRYEKFEG